MGKLKAPAVPVAENALARKALEEIQKIEQEAQKKKEAQLQQLQEAKDAIQQRIAELSKQEDQINAAIERITGRTPRGIGGPRRDLSELRERMLRWLGAHVGAAYTGEQLNQEFPELKGTAVSVLLKAAIDAGQVIVDATNGRRHQTYAVKQ